MEILIENLNKYCGLEAANRPVTAKKLTTEFIFRIVHAKEIKKLNYIFDNVDLDKLTPRVAAEILQMSREHTANIKSWNRLYFKARRLSIDSGRNPDKDLYGLSYYPFENNDILKVLKEISDLEMSGKGKEASIETTTLLFYFKLENDLDKLNFIFDNIDLENAGLWTLIAFLRSTAYTKNKITSWKKVYLRAREVAIALGRDPAKELYGLDRN